MKKPLFMNRRQHWAALIGPLCLTLALAFALYPLISNYFANRNKSLVCTEYSTQVEELDHSELDEMRQAAKSYNARLAPVSVAVEEVFSQAGLLAAAEDYDELLSVNAGGMMGYIEIPKIGVYLPIYHGTNEEVLQAGVGHLLGSSLPVGGMGTHAVLTAHSGLARETMFSDLEQLTQGDVFYLHILDETLAYEVDAIYTVLPEDTSHLAVQKGEDLCTLVTCTPFGVNTHRLLVRGSRISYVPEAAAEDHTELAPEESPSTWTQEYLRQPPPRASASASRSRATMFCLSTPTPRLLSPLRWAKVTATTHRSRTLTTQTPGRRIYPPPGCSQVFIKFMLTDTEQYHPNKHTRR